MDAGRLKRVGGGDEEALAWERAGTCTHMLTYIDTYRAELALRQAIK